MKKVKTKQKQDKINKNESLKRLAKSFLHFVEIDLTLIEGNLKRANELIDEIK